MHESRKRRHGSVHAVKVIMGDRLTAFMQKVDQSGECWEWTASKYARTGYGQFNFTQNGKRQPTTAQRAAWELLVGPIPAGMFIDHICHNRGCVKPEHLRLATPKQNNENRGGLRNNNTSGFHGVQKSPEGKWYGRSQSAGIAYETDRYGTPEEANAAVIALRNTLHTFNDLDRIHQQERAS